MVSERSLRVLAIAPYSAYPPVGGGKLRIYHLVRELISLGHQVTLWMVPPDEPTPAWSAGAQPELRGFRARSWTSRRSKIRALFSPFPEGVWAREPGQLDAVAEAFDVVVLMQALVGRYGEQFRDAGVPVILDQQNVESETSRFVSRLAPTLVGRLRAALDVWKWRNYERTLIAQVHTTVAVSDLDAAAFRSLVPTANIVVRPSGADVRGLEFVDHAENRADRLIMTGTLGYLPNLDAARWMIDTILPRIRRTRASAHLVLVGASPPESLAEGAEGVEVAGRVPDVVPYLAGADLFVAPLRAGGGTRLKILEAFAVGIPVVATSVGAEGIDAVDGVHLSIADDELSFATAVSELLDDRDRRSTMAAAARALVEERYDWRSIAVDYERDLLAATSRAPVSLGT